MLSFRSFLSEQHTRVIHEKNHKEIIHGDSFSLKIGKEHHKKISDLEHGDQHHFTCMDNKEWCAVRKGDDIHFISHPDDVRIHTNMHPKIPHAQFTKQEEYKEADKPAFSSVFSTGSVFEIK